MSCEYFLDRPWIGCMYMGLKSAIIEKLKEYFWDGLLEYIFGESRLLLGIDAYDLYLCFYCSTIGEVGFWHPLS